MPWRHNASTGRSMDKETRLKLAVQKSGRLTDPSVDLLTRCGLKLSRGKDQLMGYGENMPLDVLFVRDDDIPDLVQEDVCDLGPGGAERTGGKETGAGRPRRTGAFPGVAHARLRPLPAVARGPARAGLRRPALATGQAHRHHLSLPARPVPAAVPDQAEIVILSGAVEIAPRLGRADAVCDLVSTGSTLQANHLREVETVFESHAVLIRTPVPLPVEKNEWVERLLLRMEGVQQVKESKYIMLHAPRSALPAIRRLLPGSESPTIIPLEGSPDRVAVHAVCRENVFWETLESLKKAGASALLVLPVEKMLA